MYEKDDRIQCKAVSDLKSDIEQTMEKSILITSDKLKTNLLARLVRTIVRIFAPML